VSALPHVVTAAREVRANSAREWDRSYRREGSYRNLKRDLQRNIKERGAKMKTLSMLLVLAAFSVAPVWSQTNESVGGPAISPQTEALYRDAIVIDTHDDTPSRISIEGVDIGKRLPDGNVDIPRLLDGGVTGIFFSIWPDPVFAPHESIRRSLELIDVVYKVIEANPDRIGLAVNATDVVRLKRQGKVAALMGIALRMFHQLGVRYMTLTHSNTNDWADSSTDTPRWHGLNDLGKNVVREMNRIGMMVDLSHVSDETFYAALKVTTKPVIMSHSSCRALDNHPRNATDEMLLALAKNGGVVGINFYSEFVDQKFRDAMLAHNKDLLALFNANARNQTTNPDEASRKSWYELKHYTDGVSRPPFSALIDQIDHAVKVAGVDHVGLGSDFDGAPSTPQGMDSMLDMVKIAQALKDRGYKDEDIKKILGGNFLRVLREVTGS
jgi:membrane dipeptidase